MLSAKDLWEFWSIMMYESFLYCSDAAAASAAINDAKVASADCGVLLVRRIKMVNVIVLIVIISGSQDQDHKSSQQEY
ncbi:hypothetical protein ACHAXS_004571 [Conticribra weissflogii]